MTISLNSLRMGTRVYFTSTRDGYLCIWAQRLDPVTKHPLGPPFAYEHFHDSAGRAGAFNQFLQTLASPATRS